MQTREAVGLLRSLVKRLAADGVTDNDAFRNWVREDANQGVFARSLDYRQDTGMPLARSLIHANFHPTLPLLGLNYTNTAHVTLHHHHNGWTAPMRLCRGIVFDRLTGRLVALPFPKFFNDGENDETRDLPDEPFVATVKEDGHLGIIFEYEGDLHLTTRGYFSSPTSKLGNEMLQPYKARWLKRMPKGLTVLCEVIHPNTKVHTDYAGAAKFVLIGAFSRRTYQDLDYDQLADLGQRLEIPVTQRWEGNSIADLTALMADLSIINKEGFVVRFASGRRVKFKFTRYVGEMIRGKLSYTYAMRRVMDGTAETRMSDLPPEVLAEFHRYRDKVLQVGAVSGPKKTRWQFLYELVPAEERTDSYRQVCRSFVAHLEQRAS
ncbi:MAG: T4 RnlA family RNA ligase [Candidatus Obscuribacterales bacterium]|nr:T4 RnlA family RNA ligase [Candidatus Obscuribacterales bacterium]